MDRGGRDQRVRRRGGWQEKLRVGEGTNLDRLGGLGRRAQAIRPSPVGPSHPDPDRTASREVGGRIFVIGLIWN